MEKVGYAILLMAAIAWLVMVIVDLVPVFPEGTIGLVVLLGLGVLFVKVLRDRIAAAKNDRYSREIEK